MGPFDSTYRFPYWIDRISSGGTVLAPGEPLAPLQFIDARDLANWIEKLVTQKSFGIFNAVGPEEKNLTLGDFLEQCVATLNAKAKLEWVSEEFLKERDIQYWSVLPLWLPKIQDGMLKIDSTKARRMGLTYRPIETTIVDTWNWLGGAPQPHLKKLTFSLKQEEEALTAWKDLQDRLIKLNQENVAVVSYKNEWISDFLKEKEFLISILPPHIVRRIEHIGSTAVPGLSAKPIIDMQVEVSSFAQTKKEIIPLLAEQGYEYYWRPTIGNEPPYYYWFIKRNTEGVRTHHIHMVEADSLLWERLYFRDYLCEFPEEAARYEALKTNLSKSNTNDRTGYTVGKSEYVKAVTAKAKAYYQKK